MKPLPRPVLDDVRDAIADPIRPHRRRHWLSAFINRARWQGRRSYSKRAP